MFPTYQYLQKGVQEFAKIKKDLVSTHFQKPDLSITQDLNKIKRNLEHPLVDIGQKETCAKISAKNIELYGSWSSSKFSIFR